MAKPRLCAAESCQIQQGRVPVQTVQVKWRDYDEAARASRSRYRPLLCIRQRAVPRSACTPNHGTDRISTIKRVEGLLLTQLLVCDGWTAENCGVSLFSHYFAGFPPPMIGPWSIIDTISAAASLHSVAHGKTFQSSGLYPAVEIASGPQFQKVTVKRRLVQQALFCAQSCSAISILVQAEF